MTLPAPPPDPALALSEWSWVRRLARGLASDDLAADDLVQEAWIAARRASERAERWEAGPPCRAWVSGVLRNLASKGRRGRARRRWREQRCARREALPSAAELAARADVQRALASAVTSLREPYRTAILMRYMEELTSAEIARRLGVPEGTVRWRVKHGLERLRAEIDDERGADWLRASVLAAGAAPELSSTAAAAGAGPGAPLVLGLLKSGALATGLAAAAGSAVAGAGWIGGAETGAALAGSGYEEPLLRGAERGSGSRAVDRLGFLDAAGPFEGAPADAGELDLKQLSEELLASGALDGLIAETLERALAGLPAVTAQGEKELTLALPGKAAVRVPVPFTGELVIESSAELVASLADLGLARRSPPQRQEEDDR